MQAIQWLLLELGVMAALVPAVIAYIQWRRRRAAVQALEALSQQIKQSEADRKHTLTGILSGAHRLSESHSAEVADSLIRSERTFFRHCFNTMLSQDKAAIEQLAQNLYNVLDDYLRKCASDTPRAAAPAHAFAAPDKVLDDVLSQAESAPASNEAPITPATATAPPMPEDDVDWDAAFAETMGEPLETKADAPPAEEPGEDFGQDALDNLLNTQGDDDAETPATPPPAEEPEITPPASNSDDDIMAEWGAALEEQTIAPSKPEIKDDGFDLSWEDAFLEETVTIKPGQNPELQAGGDQQ